MKPDDEGKNTHDVWKEVTVGGVNAVEKWCWGTEVVDEAFGQDRHIGVAARGNKLHQI